MPACGSWCEDREDGEATPGDGFVAGVPTTSAVSGFFRTGLSLSRRGLRREALAERGPVVGLRRPDLTDGLGLWSCADERQCQRQEAQCDDDHPKGSQDHLSVYCAQGLSETGHGSPSKVLRAKVCYASIFYCWGRGLTNL